MKLDEYFGRPTPQATRDGAFIVSSVELVKQALRYFIEKGIVDPSGWFCDAGCGDGRVVILAASEFGIPALGVESDPEIVKRAIDNVNNFNAPVKIGKGCFVEEKTYFQTGIKFEEIKTFFNYVNNHRKLAAKIAQDSPLGTVLLIYDSESEPKNFLGLKYLETKKVPEGWEISADYYLHAYENV